jgi:SNF family Na+-dependent transporter
MKFALFVLFVLAGVTGTVAMLSVPMQALARDDTTQI